MWISKKKYEEMKKRIAGLEEQVKCQQIAVEACRRIDMSALEIKNEFQISRNSSSPRK